MIPQTTPREALYIETGLFDPETISKKQKIMMDNRIKNSSNTRLQKLASTGYENTWNSGVKKTMSLLEITENDITLTNENETKSYIADYFEELYQARPGKDKYQQHTREIEEEVKQIENDMMNKPKIKDFSHEN